MSLDLKVMQKGSRRTNARARIQKLPGSVLP